MTDLFFWCFGDVFWFRFRGHGHLCLAPHLATTVVVDGCFGVPWGQICLNRCLWSWFFGAKISAVEVSWLAQICACLLRPDLPVSVFVVAALCWKSSFCFGGSAVCELGSAVWAWFVHVAAGSWPLCFLCVVLCILCFFAGFFGWYVLICVPFNGRIGLCFCWVYGSSPGLGPRQLS